MKTILKKIPDGKLVRIDVDIKDKNINYIKITGDFFLFPETAIEDIEDLFKNQPFPLDKEHIIDGFNNLDAQLTGVSISDIIDAIEEALK